MPNRLRALLFVMLALEEVEEVGYTVVVVGQRKMMAGGFSRWGGDTPQYCNTLQHAALHSKTQ